jgi:ribosome-associated protein
MAVKSKTKTVTKTKKKEPVKAKKVIQPAKPAPKKAAAKTAAKKVTATKKPAVAPQSTPKKGTAKKAVASKKTAAKPIAPKKKEGSKKAKPAQKLVGGLPEQLRDVATKVLDDRKAEDILVIDLKGRSAIADYAIIASGGSARQLGALAEYLREAFFKLGMKKLRVEGLPQGDWVLVDAGDVIIHLFRPEVRSYYQIEDIWQSPSPTKR